MRPILPAAALVTAALLAQPAAALDLVLGHNASLTNPRHEAALMFARTVEERSGGAITVQVAGNAEQGDDTEMLTALQLGSMDISANSQGPVSTVVPEFAALGLPFLFEDQATAWRVLDGEIGAELSRLAEAQGFRVIAFWDNGLRQVSNSRRPIRTPADLRGLKIRTPPDPTTVDTFTALGASPEPLSFSELYLALEQGTFDGQENPLMNIWSSKLHEVQKYISVTNHKYECTPVLVSTITWDGLSEEQRGLIVTAAREAGAWQREASARSDAELRPKLEAAGVAFNGVDRGPFREATLGVYDTWRDELGAEWVDRVVAAARGGGEPTR